MDFLGDFYPLFFPGADKIIVCPPKADWRLAFVGGGVES